MGPGEVASTEAEHASLRVELSRVGGTRQRPDVAALAASSDHSLFVVGGGRWRVVVVELGLQSRSIRLTLDHKIVGVVDEAIDSALCEERFIERREPLGRVAIARDDRCCSAGSFYDELVHVS